MYSEESHHTGSDSLGSVNEITLLHAINQAAASLQRSARSEKDVLKAFSEQINELKLIGLISMLDETKENLVIRYAAYSSHDIGNFEKLSGIQVQGYRFPAKQADAFHSVVQNAQAIFVPSAGETITQVTPQAARFMLKTLLQAFGQMPAIFAPIKIEVDIRGVLAVVGPGLTQANTPAIEAFANHIAIALENAKLFASTRQAEARYHTLFEASTDAIFLETLEGRVLDCNSTACELFGYTRDELIGLSVTDLVPEEFAPKLADVIEEVLSTGGIFIEAYNKHKDGSIFPVEVSTRLVTINGDQLVVAYVRDVSERKQSEYHLEQTQAALRRRADELTSLHTIMLKITATHDLSNLLGEIVEQAVQLLEGSEGGFYLCDPEREEARCVVSYRTKRDFTGTVLKYGEGLAGKVAQDGQPLIINDYRNWPGRAKVYEAEQPFRAVISAPVVWQGQVTGVLHILDSGTRHFTEKELELLTLLANQAAIAIENARLLESERQRRGEAETLRQAATSLTSTLSLNAVLDIILTRLEEVVLYDSAAVFLLEGDRLYCQAARGQPDPEIIIGMEFPADNPLLLEIQESRSPLILQDAITDPRFKCWGGTDYVRSWMGIPMFAKNKVVGYLTCDSRQPGVYKPRDAKLGEAFANQAAIAIENARLFEGERAQLLLSQTLQKVGALLTSETSLDEVLENILDLLGRVIDYDSASIQLLDPDGKMFLAAGRDFEDIEGACQIVRELSDHMLQRKWATTIPVVISDTYADDLWRIHPGSEYIRSWIGAPLLVKGRFIGSLNVDSRTVNAYDPAVGETVMAFANQAAIAIENARLFDAERQRIAELEAVRQASLSLTASLELSQVLNAILESALNLLPEAQNTHIFLYNPEGEGRLTFGSALFADGSRGRPWSEPRPDGLTYTVARQGEPIVVPDMRSHKLYEDAPPDWTGAIIGLPLKIGERVAGVMNISFQQARQFAENELRLLHLLGDQAAIAIENARLFEQAATERRHLGLLYDISREITSSLDPDKILRRAITLTCQVLGGLLGEAFLYLPDEDCLSLRALHGHKITLSEVDALLDIRPGKGLTGWVAQHRQPVCVPDVAQDRRWISITGVDDDVRSAILSPILAGDQILGVLSVLHHQEGAFSNEHLDLIGAICQEVGLALSNAHRYQQVQRRLTEITLIQNLTQTFKNRLEVQTLLDEVVTQLIQKLGYSQITLFIIEEDNLVLKASHGLPPQENLYPLSRGIIGRVARTGKPSFVQDLSSDPDYYRHPEEKFVAEIAVPIFREEIVVGVISVQSEQVEQLTTHDYDLLQLLAGQISVALENAVLYEQAREHAEELEQTVTQRTAELTELYNLSQEIGYALSYEGLLKLLLQHLHKAVRSDLVVGCLGNSDLRSLTIESNRPISPVALSRLKLLWVEMLTKSGISDANSEEPNFVVIQASDYKEHKPEIRALDSLIHAPIVLGEDLIGILAVGSECKGAFGTEQERLLTTFANHASGAAARLSTILSAQQRQLESLVEHLPVGVLLLDTDFHVLVANPLGQEILSLLYADDDHRQEGIQRLGALSLSELILRESPQPPVEITLEGPPRRIFTAKIQPAGSPTDVERHYWVLTINEITQERENMARIQIQERLATVGQLAAGIAHDFNNIMAAILVYTDLLSYDPTIPQPSQEKLTIIKQQVERASSLIRQILDFSRKSVMEQSAMDLLPLVKELDKMLARVLPETIQLELAYQPGIYWVNGDPTRLQQVFMNLALNARDAMPKGGKLYFELGKYQLISEDTPPIPDMPPGNWIRIMVTDTGIGIPSEAREHIFEPFFTTKPIGRGTGLGLAQVYGIIKQHEGYIDFHSQIGKGTSFNIYLPALEIEEENGNQPRVVPQLKGKGKMVAVVEDDPTTRQALQVLLEANDYQVLTAANGTQALHQIEETDHPLDLVISDIVMPEMGGIALFRILRDQYPETKILLITGHPLEEDNRAILEKGKVHWLQKPFSVPDFNQAIKELLQGL